ncbi:MAG: hypothetical protein JSS49_09875 [Planctomycetes bacterium]|nr:hypothetical protein [Planctomycetota bacterium]
MFRLPLLAKDLIEQSARRRTYALRVVYALLLYGSALWVYGDVLGGGAGAGVANLGRGRMLFQSLIKVQFAAIIVLLPALCCGAITSEKERDTLGLLLLTQLSPTTIILEKLFSRLLTMGTYQLLSLPLFGVVYGMGGVELPDVVSAIWFLLWWSVLVGAWSIYCSAWHRTTSGAFISAYAMMPLAVCFASSCLGVFVPSVQAVTTGPQWKFASGFQRIEVWISLVVMLLIFSISMLILTGLVVWMAQRQLLSRAFVPPRNLLLEFFKKLDGVFEELNQTTTGGVLLVKDRDFGPMFAPIAWRETQKKSLGTVRYLFRFLVLLLVPLLLAIGWTISDAQSQSFNGPTAFFLTMLWPIAAVAVTVHTTNTLTSERSRQTLDMLLVAPLSPVELVTQKLAGVRRLIGVLSVPFTILILFQTIWTMYVQHGLTLTGRDAESGVLFLQEVLGMTLAMITYPRLIQWISFHLALRLKNQTQAVLFSLAIIVVVCGAPFVLFYLSSTYLGIPSTNPVMQSILWFSPIRVLFPRSFMTPMGAWAFLGLALHGLVVVNAWLMLRTKALHGFSGWMGRTEPMEEIS